jgi:exosome complex component RRP46
MAIQASLQHLHRADGSAIYMSPNGYSILAAVNGPVEVQRRDELPDEAHVEVNVRPHDGVGQVKERHLELLVANTVRDVIHVRLYPRQMVQLTLQVLKVPINGDAVGRTNAQAESVRPLPLCRLISVLMNWVIVSSSPPLAAQCSLSCPR